MKLKNRKGQIGETLTWVVATLIIIFIVVVSLFIVSTSSAFKRNNYESVYYEKTSDILATKSFAGYLLTKNNEKNVFQQLREEENLNEFNGNLGRDIFKKLYLNDYPVKIWLGIYFANPLKFTINPYFGGVPTSGRGISEEIKLDQSKSVLLTLTGA